MVKYISSFAYLFFPQKAAKNTIEVQLSDLP